MKHKKKWKEWEDLESGANKNLKYHGRIYRKDVPDDEQKLMMQMINDMNHNKRVREKRKMISTASILVNMRERKEGINNGGIGNNAGDDNNCINDGGGKNCSFAVNDEKNEDDKNGEEDEDNSNEKKEGGEGMDMSKIGSESKMGQFVDATYLTDKKTTSNVKVALKMKKPTTNKEEEINKLTRKDFERLLKGCLNGNDISSYMAFLKKRDNNMCKVEPGKKPSMFYNLEFICFDKERRPQCRESKRMRARHDKIFDMEYIFIPIHRGNHYTCAVIYMKERRVKYYNSLVSDQTRTRGNIEESL